MTGGDGGDLHDVTKSYGCALPADLGIKVTHVWTQSDQENKTLVVSGTVDLAEGSALSTVIWALLVQDQGGATKRYLGVVQVAVKISLSRLPILSGLVPAAYDLVIEHVSLFFSPEKLADTDVGVLSKVLEAVKDNFPDGQAPQLPEGPLDSGVTAALTYDFAGKSHLLKHRLGEASQTWADQPPEDGPTGQDDGPSKEADEPTKAESSGPLRVGKVDVGYAEGAVHISADFTVSLAGLNFEASGFGLSMPVAQPAAIVATIDGLGITAKIPPVELGAELLWRPDETWPVRFDGAGMLKAPAINVAIAGSYARKSDGTFSFFLFGQVGTGTNPEAGFGPPPFRVKDVSLGVGYNSEVRVPEITEVDSFPLLNLTGTDETPLGMLEKLTGGTDPWVAPKVGEDWVAAGLHWTTFEFADFRAFALIEFGDTLVISLLALGQFDFPKDLPAGTDPAVRIQIAARALYRQSEGLLSLTAQLTDESYVLDKKCKPTGGLALCTWVDPSTHAGDFVVTVGGYHPGFTKPDHYPTVPRLGVKWSISNELTLTAQAYAAVTPHAAMLGGGLSLVFDTGALRAWFTAHLDALIQWSPFYFDVSMGVTIGVRASIKVWFVHVTITVEVGVDVDLWGPPIGGLATVHLWFISFRIGFGEDRPAHLPPATWTQFQVHLPPKQHVLQSNPIDGLSITPAGTAPNGTDGQTWYASTHGFSFRTSSAVPASQVLLGETVVQSADPLHIRPMDTGGLTITHTVTITQDNQPVDHSKWACEPVLSNVPEALWGPGTSSMTGTGLLTGRLTGLTVSVPPPVLSGRLTVAAGVLDIDPLDACGLPLDPTAPAAGQVPQNSSGTVAAITSPDTGIAAPATVERRNTLGTQLSSLGYAVSSTDRLQGYNALARNDLAAEPLLVPTGN